MPIFKKVNSNFFMKWSPEMAYVLGFFAADGCMIKNNRGAHFIEFHITDKDILEKIKKLLGSNHKVSERKRNNNNKWKRIYRLQIGSKTMFKDLLLKGFTERKSKKLKMPDVPKKYLCHFVRGYFDGDGNVYANKCRRLKRKSGAVRLLSAGFTCGSKIFLEELFVRLKNTSLFKGGSLYWRGGAYRLYFSINDSKRLYDFMYKDAGNLHLSRKKKKFEKFSRL